MCLPKDVVKPTQDSIQSGSREMNVVLSLYFVVVVFPLYSV